MNKNDYIYLDHAASTPMREVAFEAYKKTEMDAYANSSGGHALSRKAKNILEESREFIASCFGAAPNEITFTSGGTEADNWIIKTPFIDKDSSAELTTTQIEHEAVLASAENVQSNGYNVNFISCDSEGITNIDEFRKSINSNTLIASVMYANNETGSIQNIKEISNIIKKKSIELKRDIYFHTDAVQAAGKLSLDVKDLGVDLMTISGHKFHGPKGTGLLYVKKGVPMSPIIVGGGQERQRRSGTENVPGIVGLANALEFADSSKHFFNEHCNELNEHLRQKLSQLKYDHLIVTPITNSLPNILNICFNNNSVDAAFIISTLNDINF